METERSIAWCHANNLSLNIGKTKELAVDFGKRGGVGATVSTKAVEVEMVGNVMSLGVNIHNNLTWFNHIANTAIKTHTYLYFVKGLRKFNTSPKTLTES